MMTGTMRWKWMTVLDELYLKALEFSKQAKSTADTDRCKKALAHLKLLMSKTDALIRGISDAPPYSIIKKT